MIAPSSFAVWGCVSGFRPSAEGRSGMNHLQSWILSQVDAPHFFFFYTVMFRSHVFYMETRHEMFSGPVQSSVWVDSAREILGYSHMCQTQSPRAKSVPPGLAMWPAPRCHHCTPLHFHHNDSL
uniref:Uncharacterized protein n=1 Tax=Pipistrellus kuhlii TaxID=59472 RepID=A0A7J8A806_PIPKU|nr:hypothetical protein mPipKuh1_008926 [Pipistrellus kuhlii]